MRKLICDFCKKELDLKDNYDEDGYSKFVSVEVRNSRTYNGDLDICKEKIKKILDHFNFHIA